MRLCVLMIFGVAVPCLKAETPAVTVDKEQIEFRIGSKLLTRYSAAPSQTKPYLWPINAPNGVTVTRGWPLEPAPPGGSVDHIHQRSGWFTYGDVIPRGIDYKSIKKSVEGVDFWAEVPLVGRIVCVEMQKPTAGRVYTRNEWRILNGPSILDEARTFTLHDLSDGWLLVVESRLQPSGEGVIFGDTKEGAFGVRMNDQLRLELPGNKKGPEVNRITNSRGQSGEKECWGRQADWCDFSGEIDGKAAGIAIFDHPSNKHRACWHVRGYGLMAANPFGREKSGFPDMKGRTDRVELSRGESITLRYGLYAHNGDVKAGKVAEAFAKFVELGKK